MKDKRFIDRVIPARDWRKLSLQERNTWIYIWMNCDESGVYELDQDLFEFDNGYSIQISDLNLFSDYIEISGLKILLKSFVSINYGNNLRQDYNPHKPLFRAFSKNNIIINSSLNQACFKLVEEEGEGEEEEEEEEEGKEEGGEASNDPFVQGSEIEENSSQQNRSKFQLEEAVELFKESFKPKTVHIGKLRRNLIDAGMENWTQIIESIPKYIASLEHIKYAKNQTEYIEGEFWKQELLPYEKQSTNKKTATSEQGYL